MIAYLALLPCAVAAIAVLAFRRSVLAASLLALATAAGIWSLEVFSAATTGQLSRAAIDAIILELLVGFVIFAGNYCYRSNRGGGQDALVQAIETLSLSPPRTVILVAVGIGVMMGSLTGYGVSMFLTVPLLLKVVSRGERSACVDRHEFDALGRTIHYGPAGRRIGRPAAKGVGSGNAVYKRSRRHGNAIVLPRICAGRGVQGYPLRIGCRPRFGIRYRHLLVLDWSRDAGVGGGLALIAFSVLFSVSKRSFAKSLTSPEILPYGLLIAAVVLQKLVVPNWRWSA